MRGPLQILKELWTENIEEAKVKTSYEHAIELKEKLESTMQLVKENLKKSQGRYKHYFDKKAKQRNAKIGDKVLVLLPTKNNKLVMQWKGPYAVVGEPCKNDFQIVMGKKKRTYHVNMLKQYMERNEDRNEICSASIIPEEDGLELEQIYCYKTSKGMNFDISHSIKIN